MMDRGATFRRTGLLVAVIAVAAGCTEGEGGAYAQRVTSPKQLIGGPSALGAVGDWLIGNDKIRVVIQDQGWSRGFGIFGGGIIDADVNRPGAMGTTDRGTGKDNFGEFFPALFLQAFDVSDQTRRQGSKTIELPAIEVIADGSDGGPAIIRTRASGGDFLTMISVLLDAAISGGGLRFETDYILRPGARHVEIVGRLLNVGNSEIDLSGNGVSGLLSAFGLNARLQIPIGDVALFGDGNVVFAPGAVENLDDPANPKPIGFDLRYSVEESYRIARELPALPGAVLDFLATAGPEVSYGYAAAPSERNYVWANRGEYELDSEAAVSKHAMLVPFLIDSFTGAFYELPPERLSPGEIHEYTKYLIVGTGDIASIRDELYRIRGVGTGSFQGEVRREQSGSPAAGNWVHIYDARRRPYSQVEVGEDGRFRCELEPGTYYWLVTGDGIYPHSAQATRFNADNRFVVELGQRTHRLIVAPEPAELTVIVRDAQGRRLPAKVSVVANYRAPAACQTCQERNCRVHCVPRKHVFDFSLGEHRRPTDLNWLENGPGQRDGRFVEATLFGDASGAAHGLVRPSCRPGQTEGCRSYEVYVSRGPEYTIERIPGVVLTAGRRTRLEATLKRVVDTRNFVSADMHIHSVGSVDSFIPLDTRVITGAAEGLEVMVSTDHNYILDYAPMIDQLGLRDWMSSIIGVELSTLEAGHFNGFPLRLDKGVPSQFPYVETCFSRDDEKVNRTSFDWVQCSPQQMFDHLRKLGGDPENTIVQVNHPRDTILGYFNQYYVNPYTGRAEEPSGDNYPFVQFIAPQNPRTGQFDADKFSFDFDALEVFNGKRQEMLHAFRVPADAPQTFIDQITDSACGDGHPNNGRGEILLREGGYIANPGAVDDWLNLMNICLPRNCVADRDCNEGLRCVAKSCVDPVVGDPSRGFRCPAATGNSDSHSASAEIGTPRTYVYVGADEDGDPIDLHPGRVRPMDIVDGVRKMRAFATNGPFVDMRVLTTDASGSAEPLEWPIGSTVFYAESNVGFEVKIALHLRSPPWIDVDEIILYANGEELERIAIPTGVSVGGVDLDDDYVVPPRSHAFDRDTVLVAEVVGSQNLFPMITPKEDPPSNVGEALSGITSSLGASFGSSDGLNGPDFVQRVRPYALTNPIFLDINANGMFDPPGNDPGPGPAPRPTFAQCGAGTAGCPTGQFCNTTVTPARCECLDVQAVRRLEAGAALWFSPPSQQGQHFSRWDIRKIFAQHSNH